MFRDNENPNFQRERNTSLFVAKKILDERQQLLKQIIPPFYQAAQKTEALFADPQTISPTGNELVTGVSRSIVSGLLSNPACSRVLQLLFDRNIWPAEPEEIEAITETQRAKIIGYSINKLKVKKKGDGKIRIEAKYRRSREKETDLPTAYSVHNIDVIYFMDALGLGKIPLSPELALFHDVPEEGSRIIREEQGKITDEAVSVQFLIDKFTEGNAGRLLVVGISALTETEAKDLRKVAGMPERLARFQADSEVQKIVEQAIQQFPDMESRIVRHYLVDPTVFGGLAVQVATAVDKLFQYSTTVKEPLQTQLKHLGISILEVEFGDRASDAATLQRLVEGRIDPTPTQEGDSPAYVRHRILLYAARLLNMYDHQKQVIEKYSLQQHFAQALTLFPAILEVKLGDVNAAMDAQPDLYKKQGISFVTMQDVIDFYEQTFKPLQQKAEIAIADPIDPNNNFIAKKVEKMFTDAGIHPDAIDNA